MHRVMFPRLALLYRLLAIFFVICLVMILLSPGGDEMGQQRQLRLRANFIREIQRIGLSPDEIVNRQNLVYQNASSKIPSTSSVFTYNPSTPGSAVNPHNFKYVINPVHLCRNASPSFVIYVHSAPLNIKKRQMIRQTWASRAILNKFNMKLVFVMGRVKDTRVEGIVHQEHDRYGDILVEDFKDTYRNLTYKAIAGLKWVSRYCGNVSYVIKSDDDILVDIYSLMEHMSSKTVQAYGAQNVILCNQWLRMKVIRDKNSKWYISKSDFPDEYFPPYCSGSVFVMSVDVVKRMYEASLFTPFFWVDDFYVTGLLVQKLNIKHKRINDGYILNSKVAMQKLQNDKLQRLKFFHVHRLTDIYKMWGIMKQRNNVTCGVCYTWSPHEVVRPR